MVINFSYRNLTLWPINIRIRNLDVKIWQSQKWPKTLLLVFVSSIQEQLKDANNKIKDLKAKIFHIVLKTMLQYIYSNFTSINFKKMRY